MKTSGYGCMPKPQHLQLDMHNAVLEVVDYMHDETMSRFQSRPRNKYQYVCERMAVGGKLSRGYVRVTIEEL